MDRFILTLEDSGNLTVVSLVEKPRGWYLGALEQDLPESYEGWQLDWTYSFIVDDKYRYRK